MDCEKGVAALKAATRPLVTLLLVGAVVYTRDVTLIKDLALMAVSFWFGSRSADKARSGQ